MRNFAISTNYPVERALICENHGFLSRNKSKIWRSLDYTRDAQFGPHPLSLRLVDVGRIGMGREGIEPPKAYASRFTVCPR